MKSILKKLFSKEKIILSNGKIVLRPRSKSPLITVLGNVFIYISACVKDF